MQKQRKGHSFKSAARPYQAGRRPAPAHRRRLEGRRERRRLDLEDLGCGGASTPGTRARAAVKGERRVGVSRQNSHILGQKKRQRREERTLLVQTAKDVFAFSDARYPQAKRRRTGWTKRPGESNRSRAGSQGKVRTSVLDPRGSRTSERNEDSPTRALWDASDDPAVKSDTTSQGTTTATTDPPSKGPKSLWLKRPAFHRKR